MGSGPVAGLPALPAGFTLDGPAASPAPSMPPLPDGFTLDVPKPAAEAKPSGSGFGTVLGGMTQSLLGGLQGTSPITDTVHGQPNYKVAGPLTVAQTEDGLRGRFKDESGAIQEVDPKRHVILTDASGVPTVYHRGEATEAGPLESIGRILTLGAVTGAAPGAASAAASAPKALKPSQQLLQDFERAGIQPSIPAVTQSRGAEIMANVIKDTPVIGKVVEKPAQATLRQTEQAVQRLAGDLGEASSVPQAGQKLQAAGANFEKAGAAPETMTSQEIIAAPTRASSVEQKAGALYDRVAEMVPKETQVDATGALEALRRAQSRYDNPALGATQADPTLTKWAKIIEESGGKLSWNDARQLRTDVGVALRKPMVNNPIDKGQLKQLYGGLTEDLKAGALQAGGPRALQSFERADQYYGAAMGRMDRAFGNILRVDNPEAAYQQIITAAQANGSRADLGKLYALKRSMPADEWGDISATILSKMGAPTAGAANELGVMFSPASFMTRYMGMSGDAKNILFSGPGMADIRNNLESLSRAIQAQKNFEKLTNASGSGRYAVVGAGALVNLPLMLKAMGTGAVAGSLMMSPRFTRWLVGGANLKLPNEIAAHVAQLDQIAKSEPQLSSAIRAFRQNLQTEGAAAAAQPEQPQRKQ